KVHIYDIRLQRYDYPHLELEVRCGKGTYLRSLARDVGERLGCGGLIAALRRLRVGPFSAEEAAPLDRDEEAALPPLLPLAMAVNELRWLTLEPGEIALLRRGQEVPLHAQ